MGCEAAFPIQIDLDAEEKDGGNKDGVGGADAPVSDSYIPPPPPDAGLWCGAQGGGDATAPTYCKGTCCVKIGNGYGFTCKALGDPCTGTNYAFSCTRPSDCTGTDLCCYTETGSIEAGTYFAESHCGQCVQMESMCLVSAGDDCPDQTVCHPWFSAYGLCY